MRFSLIKHCDYRKRHLLQFNSIKLYLLLKNKNKKNSKKQKHTWMIPWFKNKNDRSACANMFSELPLTYKFRHYLRANATSCYWSYIGFYTFITLKLWNMHSLLHHILIFKIRYSTRFSFLRITSSLLRN